MHRILRGLLLMVLMPLGALAAQEPPLSVQVLPRPTGSIAIGAQRVPVLSVRMTASCAAAVGVESLTVHHKGLGSARDIERLYALHRGIRRTRTAIFRTSDQTATLRFPSFTIGKCGTETMDIVADFRSDAAAASEHLFSIAGAQDVLTQSPVQVVVNPEGVPTVTRPVGESPGTVTADILENTSPMTYGNARNVARIRLTGDRAKDELVTAITFVNNGSARGADLQNFYLETSGHTILSPFVPSLDGDRVRIVLDPPLLIRRNESRLLYLRADIRASRRRTVQLRIESPGDVEAVPVR